MRRRLVVRDRRYKRSKERKLTIREEVNNDKELEKIEGEIKQSMYEDFLKDE